MLTDAIRLSDGAKVEVEIDQPYKFGEEFSVGTEWYVRVPTVPRRAHYTGAFANGPITLYSEPMRGSDGGLAPRYDKDGFALIANTRELREYERKSKNTNRPVEWTR